MIGFFDKAFTVCKGKFGDKQNSKHSVDRIISVDQAELADTNDCQSDDITSLFVYYFDLDIDEDEPEENFIFI